MTQYRTKYEMVLIVDSRDTYFQLNPFSWNIKKGVSLFEESRKYKIFNETYNDRWCRKLNYSYEKIKNNYILNGGAMYFSPREGIDFLTSYYNFHEVVGFRNANDQGMINAMVYSHFYTGKINIYKSYNTPVKMLGIDINRKLIHQNSTVDSILIWKINKVCNGDGSIPVLLHQYDRVKPLYKEIVKNLY